MQDFGEYDHTSFRQKPGEYEFLANTIRLFYAFAVKVVADFQAATKHVLDKHPQGVSVLT
jgi:hypothetical protein